ncbi:anti-sigma factor family protein [Paenisporosarcina cavernae]|uniref:Anti-sigma-W factor RsiW n=1 Tax=Paenisporosarcina cavernae TaxID=2320858 RepID=A0A385YYE3_9BACL|nr:zf-HC2 domain-containing protein [Paenisporosarcina cavernae]AYC30563.1 anti-sigma factor [Paenisporosarcina cavernae]
MNSCPKEIVEYMHEYLDGDIHPSHESVLKTHMQDCASCANHFQELSKVVALVQGVSHVTAPVGFVNGVTARLPKEHKTVSWRRWMRAHPVIAAAAIFLFFMSGAFFTNFENEKQFAFTKYDNLQVDGHTVIVPEGETIPGDLLVRNGDVRIEGHVEGDVTVVNGNEYMASTGAITGQSTEVNQAFEWLWYKLKDGFTDTGDWIEKTF